MLLVNPVNVVHDRNVELFRKFLPGRKVRCIYNPEFPWFSNKSQSADGANYLFFQGGRMPVSALDGVRAVVLFTAQPRVPPANLIMEAALRSVPVIVIEEVYQMMLEQGIVNNYFLPVDHFFAASDYESEAFIGIGMPPAVVETTGCMFGYIGSGYADPFRKARLKRRFGLSDSRKIATLTLRYITPNGETQEVRKKTLRLLRRGLPAGYELLVKPHPGEQGVDLEKSVASLMPSAKIADSRAPIDDILGVTDVLFDRGNSQTIIDALQRQIPVCAIPMGKRTLFHGAADEVIINDSGDVMTALSVVEKIGMSIYDEIRKRYFSVQPEIALKRTLGRVDEIAEKRELYKPDRLLVELSLCWAWMGYPRQAVVALDRAISALAGDYDAAGPVRRLSRMTAAANDIEYLKIWNGPGYRQWILQSLWVKLLYLKDLKLTARDVDWLAGYPPDMNRSHFIPYACMLYRLYKRGGLEREAAVLRARLHGESYFNSNVSKSPWRMKFDHAARFAAKNFMFTARALGAGS